MTLDVDLYDGKVATTRQEAGACVSALQPDLVRQLMNGWLDWLRNHRHSNGKVAIMGWCFGTGLALNASLNFPVDATILYYGDIARNADQLKSLHGPVLGHFATQDIYVPGMMVTSFETEMAAAGKSATIYRYKAEHAFANPNGLAYDQKNAILSWERNLTFLEHTLASE